jgi:hypothetical protein
MKHEFVLEPLNGVGPVRLGMGRQAVLAAFRTPPESFYKTPNSRYPTDAWFENGFQVFYEGDQPSVAYIELTENRNFEVVLFGIPVFTTPVSALILELGHRAELDERDPELGYTYTFPSLELAFWKPDDDEEEAPYFASVGIGVAGYFSA